MGPYMKTIHEDHMSRTRWVPLIRSAACKTCMETCMKRRLGCPIGLQIGVRALE